jgi:predicted ribosome quality control (RQC) complex YloA/Tae2 family protein
VRLTADGKTQTHPLIVKRHPLIKDVTDADLQEQFELAAQIRDKLSEANNAVIQIRKLKQQVAERVKQSNDAAQLKAAGETLIKNLSVVEAEIYQVRNQSNQDPLNFPIKINNRLAALLSMVNRGDGKPIGNALPVFNDLKAELKAQTDRLASVLAADLAAFNAEAKRLGLEALSEN